jgi:dihydroxyacetone kinase
MKMHRQFINRKEHLICDALDGFLRSSGGANLARLDGYPSIKVILRTDQDPALVAIVAGGGSGHEPAHAGLVGAGILTAAVCGELFASPSVDAVLAAIMAVTGKAGCLLIFKNYMGDRLNFGLAAERARALGVKVEIVIVKDDISLPAISQARGIAGVLFVEKIAGHFAAEGASLRTVAKMAQKAADELVSIGVALSSCTLPGIGREDRIPVGKIELGLGIHGEPGVEQIDYSGARQTVDLMAKRLFGAVRPARAYALLINNLGSTTPLEMNLLTHDVLTGKHGAKIKLVLGPAALVTSLDMHGFSLSLLPLTGQFENALRSPSAVTAWPLVRTHLKPNLIRLPVALKSKALPASKNQALADIVLRACKILLEAEARLNALDAKVGDGDTGSTLALLARHLKAVLPTLPLAREAHFFAAVSSVISRTMGGSSGVLLGILFAAAGHAAAAGATWQKALLAGLEMMMTYGGAAPGDRTLIDALAPALLILSKKGDLPSAACAARAGADATAKMTRAKVGRASYLSAANLQGIADPGAEAVALLLEGLIR